MGGSSSQQRFHIGDVSQNLGAFLHGVAERVVRAALDAPQHDVSRSAEQDDRIKSIVEKSLVSDRALNDQRGLARPVQQLLDQRLSPQRLTPDDFDLTLIVGVNGHEAEPGKLDRHR